MRIEICPYCHTRVILTTEGTCPSCRTFVRDVATEESAAVEPSLSEPIQRPVAEVAKTSETQRMLGTLASSASANPSIADFSDRPSDGAPDLYDRPARATPSQNPYQSPEFVDDERDAKYDRPYKRNILTKYDRPYKRSILWVLFSFEGRIPRRVFWGASIGTICMLYAPVFLLGEILGEQSAGLGIMVLGALAVWIRLALIVKRWHDLNCSGWWILVCVVPFIGPLIQLIATGFVRGTAGSNRYGPDPT